MYVWNWDIWKLSEFATTLVEIVFGIYVINKFGLLEWNLCSDCRLCMAFQCGVLQNFGH
jgi:hypothetical protein